MPELIIPHPLSASKRILLVEDEPLVALMLAEMITEFGFEPIGPITQLEKALQAAEFEPVDAGILNLIIGGQSAYGVAALLKSRNIPFAFASGVPHHGLEADWQDQPFIGKPYSNDDVRGVLEKLLPHHPWPDARAETEPDLAVR